MLEDFEKELNLKSNNSQFTSMMGIGAFTLFSVFEITTIITTLSRDILTIQNYNTKTIFLLPVLTSPIVFGLILFYSLSFLLKRGSLNLPKILIKSIVIFFAIVIIQFAYSFFITSSLQDKYSDAYNLYYEGIINQAQLKIYVSFIPISKYLIAAIILLYFSKKLDFK